MHTNFGGCRLRDTDLGNLKTRKTTILMLNIRYFACNKKMAARRTLQFAHNMDCDKRCMLTKFGGSQSRDQNF